MRDLYVLEASTDDGLTVRTGPHTIAEAMTLVDEHLTGSHWQHRYLPIAPTDQAVRNWTAALDKRPILEADFFVALRRAILADPEHDGLESRFVTGMLAHVDPHRPMQMWHGDEECRLGECGHPDRDEPAWVWSPPNGCAWRARRSSTRTPSSGRGSVAGCRGHAR
jgi:hypothetical protein